MKNTAQAVYQSAPTEFQYCRINTNLAHAIMDGLKLYASPEMAVETRKVSDWSFGAI